jgi:hypothetical protein
MTHHRKIQKIFSQKMMLMMTLLLTMADRSMIRQLIALLWSLFLTQTLCLSLNSRHVCLFDKYETIRGPHFAALFDQIVEQTGVSEKRVAFLSINADGKSTSQMEQDLDLDSCATLFLRDYNPISLEEKIQELGPTIFWVPDGNSFALRYLMRTSGLDGLAETMCGSDSEKSVLYVGEGAGAICGGASMALGHVRGDDPKSAREPQFRGLGLLGQTRSISFGLGKKIEEHPKVDANDDITILQGDQVFVWSQKQGDATTFVMNPKQRGAIETFQTPPPLPPLVELNIGGVECTGEPAMDPSRRLQTIGDSEWFEDGDQV